MSVELYINKRVWEITINSRTVILGIGVGYPAYEVATQVEAEAGTEVALRAFSPLRIKQAIDALASAAVSIINYLHKTNDLISQSDAEAGTGTAAKAFTAQRIAQAIAALQTAHPATVSQAEAEAGTESALRSWSPVRVAQAIAVLAKALAYLRLGTDSVDGYLRVTGKAYVDIEAVTFANPLVCDCSKSNNHNCTITGTTAVQLSNLSAGMSGMITLLNDGVGAHTVTFTTGFNKKGNGSDDYDATASKYNWISWYYNGVVTVYSITNEA